MGLVCQKLDRTRLPRKNIPKMFLKLIFVFMLVGANARYLRHNQKHKYPLSDDRQVKDVSRHYKRNKISHDYAKLLAAEDAKYEQFAYAQLQKSEDAKYDQMVKDEVDPAPVTVRDEYKDIDHKPYSDEEDEEIVVHKPYNDDKDEEMELKYNEDKKLDDSEIDYNLLNARDEAAGHALVKVADASTVKDEAAGHARAFKQNIIDMSDEGELENNKNEKPEEGLSDSILNEKENDLKEPELGAKNNKKDLKRDGQPTVEERVKMLEDEMKIILSH